MAEEASRALLTWSKWVQGMACGPALDSDEFHVRDEAGQPAAPHAGMSSELWSYEIAGGSPR